MGVPGLFGNFILKKYGSVVSAYLPNEGDEYILNLEFDMGGILHACAAKVYSYGDGYTPEQSRIVKEKLSTIIGRQELLDSFCNTVTKRLEELIKSFIEEVNPKFKRVGNLVIAM